MSRGAIDDRRHLDSVVDLVVHPRLRPLAGFTVNRVWPTPRRRLIGPFIFLDHLQATDIPAGAGFDVPPHPHIGLATVTWLFEGELMHADSLGVRQRIRPGELNWMTAGRGIAHSERSTDEERARESRIHGVQCWVALPREHETGDPDFEHVAARDLPVVETPEARLRIVAGRACGAASPVRTRSTLFFVEAAIGAGGALDLDPGLGERGIYIVSGAVAIDGETYEAGRMLVLADALPCRIEAAAASQLMLLGGEPLASDREIWWNFVSSDAQRIEAAKADWAAGRFAKVEGDDETMPMPA